MARLNLTGACIKYDDPGPAGDGRYVFADRAFERHDRQGTAVPVNDAQHPVPAAGFLNGLAIPDDLRNTGTWNDQTILRERHKQAV